MSELKNAITIVGITIVVLLVLLLGDFLGYKIGRGKLVAVVGGVALVSVIAFTIYAAVILTQK
ncbi:MAG: hypothetical protein HY663_03300 [Chloroflexi bacterium]|nr:hypothetical protein [Chloroflexota bacterium]